MALGAGTRLGPYQILSDVGAGAMGVVYRARDTRLDRDVAVKVLPPAFAHDPDRLARFEREARAVAAINHPNILAVHDIGSADLPDADRGTVRVAYLVTELLDGETLRTLLAQGPPPARKSIDIAIQAARGLAAAHDRGIVHRDIKPENIVIGRDGHVKILDFGLAKQAAATPFTADQQTMAATDAGTVMGTVGYMAPEQVRGEAAEPRTDLFALGVVLHELLTGRQAFARPTTAETMTAILREDPPDLTSTSTVSPALARVVAHALEKHPGERFQSARDFAFALQTLGEPSGSAPSSAVTTSARRPRRASEIAAWAVAIVMAAMAAALWLWPRDEAASAAAAIVAPVLPWRDGLLFSPSVAPDGRRIAFIEATPDGTRIVVRELDATQARPLNGTMGVQSDSVFWSPDGRSLGFFAGGKLKTIELASGKLEEIAAAPSGYGGTWGPDGTILFSPDERAPIFRVSAQGGEPAPVTTLDASRQDEAHRWPRFLPDGRHFVFMPWTSGAVVRQIQLGALDGTPSRTLFESESAPVVAGKHFVYVRDLPARLMAQAFNPRTLALEGRAVPIVDDDNVFFVWLTGNPLLSASETTLVYTTGKYRRSRLTWFSRTGRELGTVGDPDVYYGPAISADGTMLAVEKRDAERGASDLWTVDLLRGAFSRLTSAPGFENGATWSPDGQRIVFSSDQGSSTRLLVKNASGTGAEDVLVDRRSFPIHWSHDGRYLAYVVDGGATRRDVWIYDFERRTTAPFLASAFSEGAARFSPDGKWIAYTSDESRDAQVYVRSFPDGAARIQISSSGGTQPEWRRDGGELFYLAPDSTLMAVPMQATGAGLRPGVAQPLFRTTAETARTIRNNYAASPDGQRFLVMVPLVNPDASPLVGVLNWPAALPRK